MASKDQKMQELLKRLDRKRKGPNESGKSEDTPSTSKSEKPDPEKDEKSQSEKSEGEKKAKYELAKKALLADVEYQSKLAEVDGPQAWLAKRKPKMKPNNEFLKRTMGLAKRKKTTDKDS